LTIRRLVSIGLFACHLILFSLLSCAADTRVQGIHIATQAAYTQLQLDFNGPYRYKAFLLTDPDRLVVDLPQTQFTLNTNAIHWQQFAINHFRYSHHDNALRLVFELAQPLGFKTQIASPTRLFIKLIPDITHTDTIAIETASDTHKIPMKAPPAIPRPAIRTTTVVTTTLIPKKPIQPVKITTAVLTTTTTPFIIVLDPGHGGADSGAEGVMGSYEKNVTLAVARALMTLINKEKNMRAILTRDGDYYVGLRQRMVIARKNRADLFISIHADSFQNTTAEGASVFSLSEHGASSEAARWLAARENRADLIGGINLDDKDAVLASVLLNLSQTASNEASFNLGKLVLQNLSSVSKLHKDGVQQAGFMVLKSPDVPSILIETGFISNPVGEQHLTSPRYQQQLAQAILQGIRTYLKQHPKHPFDSTLYVADNDIHP
jgi:N-acetylmuramoyl-L-alanine amidase